MRMGMLAILLAASLAACRRDEYLKEREERDPQIVALAVRTEPRGATVRVNRIDRTWTTPCDIADYSIQRGTLEVEVSLENYEPVISKVYYDGQNPASLKLRLHPKHGEAAKAPPRLPAPPPVVEAPPAVKPAEEAKPAPVKIETVAGGTRLKFSSPNAKTRIQAKTVVSDPEKPGEIFLPDVPPEKVVVEVLDPKTDAVIATLEFAPLPGAVGKAPVAAPAPKDPVVVEADRVGEVRLVSKTYGVFVRLDPGLQLQPGEEILIFREGKEVARTKILKITKGDDKYPDGAAQVQKEGAIQKGDEVRRTKP